jgi:hypothetical protein
VRVLPEALVGQQGQLEQQVAAPMMLGLEEQQLVVELPMLPQVHPRQEPELHYQESSQIDTRLYPVERGRDSE